MAELIERDLTDKDYWRMLIARGTGRFLVLAALHQQPRHGYDLARAVTSACDGCCEPTDAMIYPTIRELTNGGYIICRTESQGQRQRKVCELTDRGRDAYRAAAEVWDAVLPGLREAVEAGLRATEEQGTRDKEHTQEQGTRNKEQRRKRVSAGA